MIHFRNRNCSWQENLILWNWDTILAHTRFSKSKKGKNVNCQVNIAYDRSFCCVGLSVVATVQTEFCYEIGKSFFRKVSSTFHSLWSLWKEQWWMIVRVVASLLCPRLSSEPPGNAPILSISSIGREMPHIWYYCQKLRWNLCCYYNALALSTTSSKWHVFTELISLLCLFGFSTWKTSLLCKERDETLENIICMKRRRWNPGKHYFYAKKKMKQWKTLLL